MHSFVLGASPCVVRGRGALTFGSVFGIGYQKKTLCSWTQKHLKSLPIHTPTKGSIGLKFAVATPICLFFPILHLQAVYNDLIMTVAYSRERALAGGWTGGSPQVPPTTTVL